LGVLFLCVGLARLSGAQQVTYVYDSAGRLALVNYGNGTGIRYCYDSAGNLVNKSFGAVPLPPRIDRFSPGSGPVAAVVAIQGAALSPVADVRFGAKAVVILSVTASEIDVPVLVGASTYDGVGTINYDTSAMVAGDVAVLAAPPPAVADLVTLGGVSGGITNTILAPQAVYKLATKLTPKDADDLKRRWTRKPFLRGVWWLGEKIADVVVR
jgi:YD repeat-containing protein